MKIPDRIRLRILAKKFKATIPTGLALPLPDNVVNKIGDGEVQMFFDQLIQLGCFQEPDGKWSKE